MNNYCSIDDVLSVAIDFRKDVWPAESAPADINRGPNTKTIAAAEVTYIIAEASEMVRAWLQPHYSPAVIDAYGADSYPPVVIYLTKAYAAIMMYEQYASTSMDRNDKLIAELDRRMNEYRQIIGNGALSDADGNLVERQAGPDVQLGRDNDEYQAFNGLKVVYTDGRFY